MSAVARPKRSDALVDELLGTGIYADRGCEYHPSCLTCPFERCRFDSHSGIPGIRSAEKARRARELHAAGMSVPEICAEVGVERRQAFRYLAARDS